VPKIVAPTLFTLEEVAETIVRAPYAGAQPFGEGVLPAAVTCRRGRNRVPTGTLSSLTP
jgi:hypothetical protein